MPSDMWVLRLSQTTRQGAAGGAEANRPVMNETKSSSVRVSPIVPRTLPMATSKAAIRAFVPCLIYSNSRRSTCPGFIGRLLAARSRACIPVISSTETVWPPCAATVGAVWYTVQMSAHLSSKPGSGLGVSQ